MADAVHPISSNRFEWKGLSSDARILTDQWSISKYKLFTEM